HCLTVALNLLQGRTRQMSAASLRPVFAERFVIGVEEKAARVRGLRSMGVRVVEKEAVEKPGGVCEMPLGWTDEGSRLHHVIFHFQTATNLFSLRAAGSKDLRQSQLGIGQAH